MSFNKITTIKVSERVFDIVCEELDCDKSDSGVKIDGYLECFNNCREQGYVLTVSSDDYDNSEKTEDSLCIWAFECRNSDDIIVSWQTEYHDKGMFSDDTYKNRRKYFSYGEYQAAADFIIGLVKKHFEKEFETQGE